MIGPMPKLVLVASESSLSNHGQAALVSITAFGQACAYRLFSHKSYIVVPVDSPEDDIGRLDTLGRIFGIGLILFNAKDPQNPSFEIRVRAAKHEPDMFYVNRCMRLVEDQLFA